MGIALNLLLLIIFKSASVTDTGAYSLAEFVRKSPHLNSLAFIFSGYSDQRITYNNL